MDALLFLIILLGGALLVRENRRLSRRLQMLEDQQDALSESVARHMARRNPWRDAADSTATLLYPEAVPATMVPEPESADGRPLADDSQPTEPVFPDALPAEAAPVAAGEENGVELKVDTQTNAPVPQRLPRTWRGAFEELFGARLPVWAGGIAIAFAGIFLVRYAIDLGLLTPAVRVGIGVAAGLFLVALAEAARRFPATQDDPRVAQALAGAGVVTLYAIIYLASRSYGFLSAGNAILGMGGVTALALLLALRHGPPTALLGLLGGFAAPAFLSSEGGSIPMLLLYLGMTIAGLLGVGKSRRWSWLSTLALVGGLVWGGALLLDLSAPEQLRTLSLFLLALGVAAMAARPELTLPGRVAEAGPTGMPIAALVVTALLFIALAISTARAGLEPADWFLQGALSAAALGLTWRDPRFAPLPLLGLLLGLASLAVWDDPKVPELALVVAGLTLLHSPAGFLLLHRHPARRALLLHAPLAAAGSLIVARAAFPSLFPPIGWAMGAIIAALAPLLAAIRWAGLALPEDQRNQRLLVALAASLVLGGLASFAVLPVFLMPAALALLALVISLFAPRLESTHAHLLALPPLAASMLWALFGMGADADGSVLISRATLGDDSIGALSLVLGLLLAGVLLLAAGARSRGRTTATLLLLGGVALLILGLGQGLPTEWRPIAVSVLAAALALVARKFSADHFGFAVAGAVVFLTLFIIIPLAEAVLTSVTARMLSGEPVLRSDLPTIWQAVGRLAVPGLLVMWLPVRELYGEKAALLQVVFASIALGVAAYVLMRQPFAIDTSEAFLARGFAERNTISAILFMAGLALLFRRPRSWMLGAGLLTAAVMRLVLLDFGFYNLILVPQSLGSLPLLNWLAPAFLLPAVVLAAARRSPAVPQGPWWPICDVIAVLSLLMFGIASVAHGFRGPVPALGELSNSELYGYSAAAILTALVSLGWGTRTDNQVLRIVSLVLLLGAVLKVFLVDAAALDGLLRVASFLGLGLSLIAVSWFYTRYVFRKAAPTGPAQSVAGP